MSLYSLLGIMYNNHRWVYTAQKYLSGFSDYNNMSDIILCRKICTTYHLGTAHTGHFKMIQSIQIYGLIKSDESFWNTLCYITQTLAIFYTRLYCSRYKQIKWFFSGFCFSDITYNLQQQYFTYNISCWYVTRVLNGHIKGWWITVY